MVYILEAHPVDAWQSDNNLKEKISVHSPRSLEERCAVAETCVTKLSVRIPPLVDDVLNTTELQYTAWPDRLYVIDRDGRIAYKSKPGPFGFKPAEVEQTLRKMAAIPATRQAQLLP